MPEETPDRHQQDRQFLTRSGDREVQGNMDADSYTGDGTLLLFTVLSLTERISDPPDPPEGKQNLWLSDGTGSTGDDGDLCIISTAGETTKKAVLWDFSAA